MQQPMIPGPQPSPSAQSRKRPAGGAEMSIGPNRELQPRTPGFLTVNEPIEPVAYPVGLADSGEQRKKKRGRPSKAEAEVKAAEYAARGEPYPPPRKPKNPKPLPEGASPMGSSITFTPVTMGPSAVEGTSSGKKRTPRTKAPKDDDGNPGYGLRTSAPQQVAVERVNPFITPETTTQATPPETVPARVYPTAQEQTRERQDLGEARRQQEERARAISTEGFTARERTSSAHEREATEGMVQTREGEDQQTLAEPGSPEAAHGSI
ncbi:MAG: hypothetical protein LQ352_000388 [Teloschistes flavicans]|nr:MAG: hypothetical protein LQ352_000388 [Teloschistes flavicans]